MHSISFTFPAQEDIRSLHTYIATDNPAAASRLVLRIRDVCEKLRDFPEMGRLREDLPTSRQLRSIGCKPYSIFYEVQANHIEIIRVIHMSMDVQTIELEP
jgi:plasmid stabilization system protein ParE